MKAHQQITTEITPRRFLELCLAENADGWITTTLAW